MGDSDVRAPVVLEPEDTRAVIAATVTRHHSHQRILCGVGSLLLILVALALTHLYSQIVPPVVSHESERTVTTTAQRTTTSVSARNRIRAQLTGNDRKTNARHTARKHVEKRSLLAEVFASDEKREIQLGGVGPAPVFARAAAMQTIRERRGGMTACAVDATRRGETPPAWMDVAVQILPSGRVASVTVSRKRQHPALSDCVERRIADWRFPPFRGSTQSIAFSIDLEQPSL
jgi:hypothetical protein